MIINKMDPSERIKTIMLELQIDRAEVLGRRINIDGDLIRNLIHRRTKKMSGKVAKAISDTFPISYKWLMVEDGDMFAAKEKNPLPPPKEDNSCLVCEEKERVIKLLESQIAEQNDRIAEQKEVIKYQEKCIEEMTRLDAVRPSRRQTS